MSDHLVEGVSRNTSRIADGLTRGSAASRLSNEISRDDEEVEEVKEERWDWMANVPASRMSDDRSAPT